MNKKNFKNLLNSVNQAGEILRGELTPIREFQVEVAKLPLHKKEGFALCIKSDEAELLIPSKIYRAKFSSNNYVGVTDETGESAIYPADFFLKLDFPSEVENVLETLQKTV